MTPPAVERPTAAPQLRECPGCGLFQMVPALAPDMTAQCARCSTTLHRTARHPLDHSMALVVAALVLLVVMCVTTLMSVQTAGISHSAYLLSGPEELVRRGMPSLAVVVVGVTLLAPFGKLAGTLYVLIRLHERAPPRHLRKVFIAVERLRPWSMIEVFVFGVFVAYVKLGDLVQITLGVGVYSLLCLTVVYIWADSALDRQTVWARLDPDSDRVPADAHVHGMSACEVCELVSAVDVHDARCPRCDTRLHHRRPDSVTRTWALVLAAFVLYVPANYYPVLTVMQLGAGAPSTIIGGVRELVSSGMYPLAALVFFASIAVPMLKLVGLSVMLVAIQTRRAGWLRDRTRLYYVIRWIGRWSMIDIFMESLLGALVQFGSVITIEPGVGAVAFCGVVILTMFAAETFDPRVMWDAAAHRRTGDAPLAEPA